ncbi:hypothetical protein HJC23_003583 [Cyclotella cryptica]|uniref:Ricin B lectin domain-containing protein n=1 Tax=Cyclotella cryptica TaxID=29204 RepID=A0ABD3NWJ4_9STRA
MQRTSSRVLVADSNGIVGVDDTHNVHNDNNTCSLWKLERTSRSPVYLIRSVAYNDYCLSEGSTQNGEVNVRCINISDVKHDDKSHHIIVHYLSGELCFLSSPKHNARLSCNHAGKLSMSPNWKGWEVLRIVKCDDSHVRILSWTHNTQVLHSNRDGNVFMKQDQFSDSTKWIIELAPSAYARDGVVIKSAASGNYLCFDGSTLSTHCCIDRNSVWDISSAHKQKYYLTSVKHNKRMSCNQSTDELFCTRKRGGWEVWEVQQRGSGLVSFKSCVGEGKYLSCDSKGLIKLSNEAGENELWNIQNSPHGGLLIYSKNYITCHVACDSKNVFCSKDSGCQESWIIEYAMPPTISKGEIIGYSIASAVSLVSIIAMPFAVMGVVGAMGFTSAGITAGSIGAGMMSAEAIASGVGGVAAGGTVATLQSIGAVGLGFGGTLAAMGAGGGVVGATAFGSVAAANKQNNKFGGTVETVSERNRPFCDWRSWA